MYLIMLKEINTFDIIFANTDKLSFSIENLEISDHFPFNFQSSLD